MPPMRIEQYPRHGLLPPPRESWPPPASLPSVSLRSAGWRSARSCSRSAGADGACGSGSAPRRGWSGRSASSDSGSTRPWKDISLLGLLPAGAVAGRGRRGRAGLATALVLVVSASCFGALRLRAFPPGQAPGATPAVEVISGHNLAADPLAAYLAVTAGASAAPL